MPRFVSRVDMLLGWILRCNRILAADSRWSQAKRFSAALSGHGRHAGFEGDNRPATGESQVSRWETGAARPPYEVIARYEELLELRQGSLTAVLAIALRYAAVPGCGACLLDRQAGTARSEVLEDLLDRALSNDVMAGSAWDKLSAAISTAPQLVITPRRSRETLAGRLLSEMIVSTGVAWQLRFEALNRLLDHPSCGPSVVEACASLVADTRNQIFIEPLGVLDGTSLPDASFHVIAQLVRPTNERALRGAIIASARKVRYGHFTHAQLAIVADRVRELWQHPLLSSDVRVLARAMSETAVARPAVPRTPAPGAFAGVASRLVQASISGLDRELPDPVLDRYRELVTEMLCHPHGDGRIYAAMLIAATPLSLPLARALGARIAGDQRIQPELLLRMLTAIRALGREDNRELVEQLATSATAAQPVVEAAAFAVGHLPGHSSPEFWIRAVTHHAELWRRRPTSTSSHALSGLVYSLGISGQCGMLRSMGNDPTTPEPARAATLWWLNLPEHVRRSARL